MGLFSRKQSTDTTANEAAPAVAKKAALPTDVNVRSVLIRPRITEKAVGQSERNVYTFVVRRDATKRSVAEAIKAIYNVTPVKVNIVNKAPAKRTKGFRGAITHEAGLKKAYVYLKQGDTITLV